jgi:DNA primase large subunit
MLKEHDWSNEAEAKAGLTQEYARRGITLDTDRLNTEAELVHAAEVIDAYDQMEASVTNLHSALTKTTGAFDVLAEGSTSSAAEQRAAYDSLAEVLTSYFGEFAVGDDFIKENLDLMKQWANGSQDALEELEEHVLQEQLSQMFDETGKKIKFSSEQLKQFNTIGKNLKFGQKLRGEDIAALRQL